MATPSAIELNAQYEFREVPLELIDDPEIPERVLVDDKALADLAISILNEGLIKPLVVKPVGERFEVSAGHRRVMACRLVNYTPVPCRVIVNGMVDPLAILVHENAHTEKVNPIDEARFYRRLLDERCENDVDALCIMVHRGRDFVEDRLLLLRGWPKVVTALQHEHISMAVARELNKIHDEGRLLLTLDNAINVGATARQVAQWRKDAEMQGAVQMPAIDTGTNGIAGDMLTQPFTPECLFCEDTHEPHLMKLVYLHAPCERIVLKMLQRVPKSDLQEQQ